MSKRTNTKSTVGSSAVRKASRDAAAGVGVPGMRNPNRTVRFADRSKVVDRRAARGRSVRSWD